MSTAGRWELKGTPGEIYEQHMVPAIFARWAPALVDAAHVRAGERVLDVACGTGVVTRLVAERVGPKGRVVGLDLNPGMLATAQTAASGLSIEWHEGSALSMAVADATFDAVLCQQGLQFFPDRPSALREMRRVLRPSGRTAIAVWGELERNQIYAAFHAALQATVRSDLAELITAPFSWPSGTALKSAAEDVGFRNVRLSTRSLSMVLEGGLEQAIQSFAATPVAPGVGELPQDVQQAFFAHLRQEMTRLLRDGKVIGEMTSNMIIAHC